MISIYTDGAAIAGLRVGSYGYIKVIDNKIVDGFSEFATDTTVNRMEMTAILEGIKTCKLDDNIHVYSDSMLCVNTFNKWLLKWNKINYRIGKKKEVKNIDLCKELFLVKSYYKNLKISWVKAHSTNSFNNHIDYICGLKLREGMDKNKFLC